MKSMNTRQITPIPINGIKWYFCFFFVDDVLLTWKWLIYMLPCWRRVQFLWYPLHQPLHLHQAALYLLYQGRIFFKIWLPSFTLKLCVLWKAGKKLLWVKPKRGIKHHEGSLSKTTMKGQSQLASKLWPDLDSACLKAPITTFCLTILMDLNFPQIFWFYLLSYLPLLHEATAVGFRHSAYTSLLFITRDGDISGIAHL